jgi:iduronate 2-sulfatase
MKMTINKTFFNVSLISFIASGCLHANNHKEENKSEQQEKMNVILISVDDLRTELGYCENNQAITPNFNRLSASGISFMRAYCQSPVSAPSRASLMTGLRPDSTHVWYLGDEFRKINPDIVTMPQYFKKFGYLS